MAVHEVYSRHRWFIPSQPNPKGLTMKTAKKHYRATYWNNEGELQETYDLLHDALVPKLGVAPTPHGNAVRQIANIYHEIYNNGGYNAVCSDYDGSKQLTDRYESAVNDVVVGAQLTDDDRKTLTNALRYADSLCSWSRPLVAKRLDDIVTKVTRFALRQTLSTLPRPKNNNKY